MELSHLIKIPVIDSVRLNFYTSTCQVYPTEGVLCLTSHHLIYSSRSSNKKSDEFLMLHSLIDSVETKIKETNRPVILIKSKDFQVFMIEFPSIEICQSVFQSLESLSNIESDEVKYPFYYQLDFKQIEDGWQSYTVDSEYRKYFSHKDSEWRLSNVNKDFKICQTYPEDVIVPKIIDDALLIKSSEFRMGGRFPVLSYYHKDRKSFLMRCSQPMIGTSNRRCKEDETILNKALPSGKKGIIYDTRELSTARSAVYKGGGYETDANYSLWKRFYRKLETHNELHVSYSKLIEACNDTSLTNDKWLNKLDTSGWQNNVRQAMHFACSIADEMYNKNACILLHGNEGTDNTLLISSIVQIILNPDCRTIIGFQALIEREWIHAGHPFSKRCFKSAYGSTSQKQEGPVFVLFLDCVWQMYQQFRLSFEFNEDFLILLFDNLYSSRFGTFLGNSEKERKLLKVSSRTISLWSYINNPDILKTCMNTLYEPNTEPIWPTVTAHSIKLWLGLYMRYQLFQPPLIEAKFEFCKIKEKEKELKTKVISLRKEILDLEKEAIEHGLLNIQNAQ